MGSRAFRLVVLLVFAVVVGMIAAVPWFTKNASDGAGTANPAATGPVKPGPKKRPAPRPGPVRAVGVMINGPIPFDEKTNALAFFGSMAHTRVALLLHHGDAKIVELLRESSKISKMFDDRGRDLLAKIPFGGPYEMLPRVSKDGHDLVCTVQSNVLPTPGARSIDVVGEIAMLVADSQIERQSDAVHLQKGTQLQAGDFAFTTEKVGESQFGGKPSITVVTRTDPAPISDWWLVDREGKEHPLRVVMTMSGGTRWTLTLASEKPLPTHGALKIRQWDHATEVHIPYHVRVGVGLQ